MMNKGLKGRCLIMKINFTFLVLVLALIYSCSSDDIDAESIPEEQIKNKIELKIDGVPPENSIRGLSATLCCDRKINVSFEHLVNYGESDAYGGNGLSLSLDVNGNLIGLSYNSYNPNEEYVSPYFTPTSTLKVTDFEFVENEILKFRINGQIVKDTYNFYAEPESVNIKAEVEIKDFNNCTCSSFSSKLTSNNDLNFHSVTRTQQGTDIRYLAYTNNGYQIEFKNLNETLRNLPLGVYSFDENSTSPRIDLRKFTGVPRAFIYSIIPEEWLRYETSGNFEILERQQLNSGEIVTKVKFNLIAKDHNEVIFEFENAMLETQM
ncbi:hypothetical protein [Salinimicrobium sp. GXAS 041]|uniref:hypothetical protein n=1 Tax=Salinimicrobium sp. GXAS 041 TaxID=3400806 RepID=UPI003C72EB52